mmetsp:Transcript_114609/g.356954  ORF Transcript_114609/g.356954 Transcript_114609/m.356954 type:complete len:432 (-) Transcript_114609:426-1721(-)
MVMACFTASRPSFASFKVWMFRAFSCFRKSVALPRAAVSEATSVVSWAISAWSSSDFASRPDTSTLRVSASRNLYSRSFRALPSSSSQKPFFEASAVASASSRSTSCWMSVLTFSKGSAIRREAMRDSGVLRRRRPSSCSNEATASCRARREDAASARARKPWLRTWADTPWRKDGGVAVLFRPEALEPAAPAGGLALAFRPRSRSAGTARRFTAASRLETLFFSTARAPESAASSSPRSCARWSQSLARTSQRSVSSFRYSWSSFNRASLFTRSVLAEAISLFSVKMSCSRLEMAAPLTPISSERLFLVLSHVAFVFFHSSSSSVFLSANSVCSFFRMPMMPCEWYLYVGSEGSTDAASCNSAETSRWPLAASRPMDLATSMLLSTALRTAMSAAGVESSMALMALARPLSALERSAASASYSASSLAHC